MSYKSFLISNYATGLDRELQPWLLPNDALVELLDGYVYRGVMNKRYGYSKYSNTVKATYAESRMVHQISDVPPNSGAIDGVNSTYTWTLTAPVARGSVTITGSNPAQTLTDSDGDGVFSGPDGTGTINYTTGEVEITFTTPPAVGSTVLLTYSYHQGLPVMGVMNFYPQNNVKQLILADTRYVNRYNPTTDRLEDLPAGSYNGDGADFWSWVNYEDASSNPRLLFCNGVVGDVIQQYDGTSIVNYAPNFSLGTLNAKQMFNVKDRLVLFQTIESSVLYPRRIRISGTGVNCDNFNSDAPGAGFIDIPDNTWFFGADFNRDDVMFFTAEATWALKYTGNDIAPFSLVKIDGSRGSGAAFSVKTYLNKTIAMSPRGLIVTDGYQVARADNNIPDFTFDDILSDQFDKCFSGFLDEDRDMYIIYPSETATRPVLLNRGESDRILVLNFEEDNFAIYRIPLSCMGNFILAVTIAWSDLTADEGYPNWESLAQTYGNWNAFPFSEGEPVSIGGGHKGEVWRLSNQGSEDNPQRIRDMTVIDSSTLRVTTDWNNYLFGDNIVFQGVSGMTQVNNKQAPIKAINSAWTIFDVDIPTLGFGEYTGGGTAAKTISFQAVTKDLNPFIDFDKKVRCGWAYFYVSVTNTSLTDADNNPVPAILEVNVITDNTDQQSETTFKYEVDLSNLEGVSGSKTWVKIWINQTAKFLQFRLSNNQAGAEVQVHAMMLGFQPVGRLI